MECEPRGKRQPRSPPPCGEGLGVGGTPTSDVLESPHPVPPRKGEGTLWLAHDSISGGVA